MAALLLLTSGLLAGRVTWEPLLPWQGGTVTIYYDANAGTLPSAEAQVYIHIGYNGWTNILLDPPMTATETPGIWSYNYDIPANATIIDFVFNDDPSGQGKWDNNGGIGVDWHIEVFEPGITAVLLAPQVDASLGDPLRAPVFAGIDDTVMVVGSAAAIGTAIETLTLLLDGAAVAMDTTDSLEFYFIATDHGTGIHLLTLVVVDTSGQPDSVVFSIVVIAPQTSLAPPAGTVPGVNVVDASTVTVALFGPHKDFIYLIGDFNDWKVDSANAMNRYDAGPDSTLWWLTISALDPDKEYGYQYLLDGGLRVADPFATKILDPWNDSWISAATYPGLKPYPDGKTIDLVSAFQTGGVPYVWQDDGFVRRPKEELVIYELLVRDFVNGHDYSSMLDKIEYLAVLGINAVELMPVNEFEGNSSWGYNTSFHFALDKYYGPPGDFRAFVDSCHSLGIAVIIDLVLNHVYFQSSLVQLYWDADSGHVAYDSPWINQQSNFANTDAHWGFDINHESEHTQYYVDRVNRFWVEQYHVDGFRFDFTKGYSNTPHSLSDPWGSLYDAARIRLLKRMADRLWETDSSAYVILEHLAENNEELELANYGMLLWGNTNYNYSEATMGYNTGSKSDFSWGYYGKRDWTVPHLVTYMESHDEERLMYKNLQYGNSSGDYSIKDLPTALNRIKLAMGFFLTIPGPKMIWQFGELGYDYSIDYGGRLGEKPIRWDYLQDPDHYRLNRTVAALLRLRREQAVFRSSDTQVTLDLGRSTGLKRIHLTHPDMNVTIIGNFAVVPYDFAPNFQSAGTWYDFFSGDSIEVVNPNAAIELAPGQFHIFTDERVTPPEPGLLDILDFLASGLPMEFALAQNYPNPFNPTTNIQFSLPTATPVSLVVYDILGREVAILLDRRVEPGHHQVTWDGRDATGREVPSGIYLHRMITPEFRATIKMLLLK